jgi:hypothetical protein
MAVDLGRLAAGSAIVPALVVTALWLQGGEEALSALVAEVVVGNLQFVDFRKELPLGGTSLGLVALALAGILGALRREGTPRVLVAPLHLPLLLPMGTISLCLALPTTPGVGVYAWLPVLAPAAVYAGLALATLLARASAGGFRARAVATTAVVAALVAPAAYSARLALVRANADQLAAMRALLRHACPGEPVLDGTALAVFRPSAYWHRVFILGIREWVATGVVAEDRMLEEIRRAGPRVAYPDRRLQAMLQVAELVARHYIPHPDGIMVSGAVIPVSGDPGGGRGTVDLVAPGPYWLALTDGLAVTVDQAPVAQGMLELATGPHAVTWTGPPGRIRLAAATCPERHARP